MPAFLRGLRDSREGAGEPEGEGVRVGGWARGPAGRHRSPCGARVRAGEGEPRTHHRIAQRPAKPALRFITVINNPHPPPPDL